MVVETQIIHYNLYETSAVDPRAAYGAKAILSVIHAKPTDECTTKAPCPMCCHFSSVEHTPPFNLSMSAFKPHFKLCTPY